MTTLIMYRGDDRAFPITLTEDGVTVDLTGYTVKFSCRTAIDATDETISLSSDVAYGSGFEVDLAADQATTGKGKVTVNVPSSATIDLTGGTTLLCDVELTDPDGKVRTLPDPDADQSTLIKLKVREDVTHA